MLEGKMPVDLLVTDVHIGFTLARMAQAGPQGDLPYRFRHSRGRVPAAPFSTPAHLAKRVPIKMKNALRKYRKGRAPRLRTACSRLQVRIERLRTSRNDGMLID